MSDDTKAAADPYHMADRRIASCCGHPVNAHGGNKPNAVCDFERSFDGARWMCLCEEGRMDAAKLAADLIERLEAENAALRKAIGPVSALPHNLMAFGDGSVIEAVSYTDLRAALKNDEPASKCANCKGTGRVRSGPIPGRAQGYLEGPCAFCTTGLQQSAQLKNGELQ